MFQISLKTESQLLKAQVNLESVIYGIKNLVNNKIYVGKSSNVKFRKKAHESSFIRNHAVNEHLQRAIDKYGIENFEFIIIEFVDNNIIDKQEIFWIDKYNSFDENFGYNKTFGGDGGNLTIETKIKLSKTSPNKKMVYQFSKDGTLLMKWNAIRDVQRKLGYLPSTISKACSSNTNNNSAYGYYWSYTNKLEKLVGIGQETKKIKIRQFDLENNLINVWNSISEASIKTNSSKSSIIRCCKNKQKTCNNFIWKYLNLNNQCPN